MRKHQANYEEFWDGQVSEDKSLESFDDYIKHVAESGRWAGSLEADAF